MIEVDFHEIPNRKAVSLRMTGHAGNAPQGQDTVCAAASILAYTAAQNAVCLYNEEKLDRAPAIRLEKGEAEVTVEPKEEFYDETLYGFWICQLGYILLSRGYPNCVTLKPFGKEGT